MSTIYLDILFGAWVLWMIYDKLIFPKSFGFQRKSLKNFRKHLFSVHRMQWDVFPARTNELFLETIAECDKMLKETDQDKSKVKKFIEEKEEVIKKALPKKYTTKLAENVDSFMVTFAIAFAIRAVIFQPFKIPTGSMQPTLFGITANNASDNRPDEKYERSPAVQPKGLRRFLDGIYYGRSYYDLEIPTGSRYVIGDSSYAHRLSAKETLFKAKSIPLLSTYSWIESNGKTLLFPGTHREFYAAVESEKSFDPLFTNYEGEVIQAGKENQTPVNLKGHVQTGDFLFVNRMTYNFQRASTW